jgi:hypothetical protein
LHQLREDGLLSREELAFLKSQNLTADDVYDGRDQFASTWKARARALNRTLVLGAPCQKAGHRLRTRSGHCAQCDTSKISYQRRYHSPGYIYIAGSRSAQLIKIGTAIDIDQRLRNLRNQEYGGIQDWVMLFTAQVKNAGEIEQNALRRLKHCQVIRTYDKDGLSQDAAELLRTSFSNTFRAIQAAIGSSSAAEQWRSPKSKEYEFKHFARSDLIS